MNINNQSLHERAVEIASRFHRAESELIDILQKIDQKRIFMLRGYSSLFDYAVKALKLSEANASNFITIARKSIIVPELKLAIASGDITVSKARKITPVITRDNSQHWLELAKTLPKPKLEKEVAKVSPAAATPDKTKYIAETRLEIKFGISEELMKKFKRAQDLVSQKKKKASSFEETLSEMLSVYLQKQDPVEKAKRNIKPVAKQTAEEEVRESHNEKTHQNIDSQIGSGQNFNAHASVPGTHSLYKMNATTNTTNKSLHTKRYIPAETKHVVALRDQGQCTHHDNSGQRCENQRWLEVHHKLPLAQGGTHSVENLATLCSGHHKQQHMFESI